MHHPERSKPNQWKRASCLIMLTIIHWLSRLFMRHFTCQCYTYLSLRFTWLTLNYTNNVVLWNNCDWFQLKMCPANSSFPYWLLWEIFNRKQMHTFSQPEFEGQTHRNSAATVVCNAWEKQKLFTPVRHQDIIINSFLLLLLLLFFFFVLNDSWCFPL